jgi:dihydroflavonol-4-reductase
MKCFVTGASGFIGSNLVHELIARGHRVKALLRPNADERALLGLKYERVTGDILDRDSLARVMDGCDWCFHCAASHQLWLRNYQPMHQVNVEGTRNVFEAAGRAGCQKIVFTSTVACIAMPTKKVDGKILPSTELDVVREEGLETDYRRSKFKAEALAVEMFRKKGLPIVIVNPSAPIGPNDLKPTPIGRIIVDFLNHRMPAYVDTGLNWVHVRDVATGHVLAAERGTNGERYILGNAEGNWTMHETLAQLAKISGVRAPRMKIPHWLALRIAEANEIYSFFTNTPPRVPVAGVKMSRDKMWFNPIKAVRQLGLPQTPPEQAFADAVNWFRVNGYVKK